MATIAQIAAKVLRETYRAVRTCSMKFEKCPVTGFNRECSLENHHSIHITMEQKAAAGSHRIVRNGQMPGASGPVLTNLYFYRDQSVMSWRTSADARTEDPAQVCRALTRKGEHASAELLLREQEGNAPESYARYECLNAHCSESTVARIIGGKGIPMNLKTDCPHCGPTNQILAETSSRQEWAESQERLDVMYPDTGPSWQRNPDLD